MIIFSASVQLHLIITMTAHKSKSFLLGATVHQYKILMLPNLAIAVLQIQYPLNYQLQLSHIKK
jgi:hypothetical protein